MSVVLATRGAAIGTAALGASKQFSQEYLGYDFVGLGVKVLIFYAVALLMSKYFELVIGTNNVLRGLLDLLHVSTPNFLPHEVIDFYTNGIHGVKYWDLVKGLSIVLVIIEYQRYVTAQKMLGGQPSAFTEGIFFLIIGFLLMITIWELWQHVKDFMALATPPAPGANPDGTYTL